MSKGGGSTDMTEGCVAGGGQYLSGVRAVLVEQGIGKARYRILTKQLVSRGGELASTVTEQGVTHVVVGGSLCGRSWRLPQLLKVDKVPDIVSVVSAEWLSSCLVEGRRVGEEAYLVREVAERLSSPPLKKNKPDAEESTAVVGEWKEDKSEHSNQHLIPSSSASPSTITTLSVSPTKFTSSSTKVRM